MLTTLVMLTCLQLPMDKIINPPRVQAPAVVVKKVYIVVDKFGVEHESEDKSKALQEAANANKQPFRMKDAAGVEWSHQDAETLRGFINTRNSLLGQYKPQAFVPLNCSPVG